ncbi:MAG: DUF1156 domain-containing protein [Methanoculleus sp.]|jgi:hypothetical protein
MSNEHGAIRTPKKLIETALPLDEINAASVREKSIRHGHPSTLHLWWARRRGRMKIPDERCACLLREPGREVEEHPAWIEPVVG